MSRTQKEYEHEFEDTSITRDDFLYIEKFLAEYNSLSDDKKSDEAFENRKKGIIDVRKFQIKSFVLFLILSPLIIVPMVLCYCRLTKNGVTIWGVTIMRGDINFIINIGASDL